MWEFAYERIRQVNFSISSKVFAVGLEKSRQIMILFKLLGHVDYGRTNKDWMFPGLFVYKHFVLKRGEGDKKVATIKGGINSKY